MKEACCGVCHAVLRVAAAVQEPHADDGVGVLREFILAVDCGEDAADVVAGVGDGTDTFEGVMGLRERGGEG